MASVNGTAVGISVTVMGLICTSDKATLHTPFMELVQSPDGGSLFMFLRILGPGSTWVGFVFLLKYFPKEVTNKTLTALDGVLMLCIILDDQLICVFCHP